MSAPEPAGQKFRIVAIDDERDILELIRISLEPRHEVVALNDSSEAMETLEMAEPDLVLVDVMMPKTTGYQIVEEMRRSARLQNITAAFLSAKDTPRDIKYGYKLGANFYLTKPFQPDRLLKAVDTLLEPLGHPRRKTMSMRDLALRMENRVGAGSQALAHGAISAEPVETGAQSGRMMRPLAQQASDVERKKWVG